MDYYIASLTSPLHILNTLSPIANLRHMARALTSSAQGSFNPRDFDVDYNTGFFPSKPLPKLTGEFSMWEDALAKAQQALCLGEDETEEAIAKRPAGETWRATVRSWPVLDTSSMSGDLPYLQKSHMVLAFVLHFYVHSTPRTGDSCEVKIPASLAIPLVAVSKELGMPPVATFADTVLWNWDLVDNTKPLSAENIHYVHLLSGTKTERAFYAASGAIELKGVEMLQVIESFVTCPDLSDITSLAKLAQDLNKLAKTIDELTKIFLDIRNTVDPDTFYWHCRPWWNGAPPTGSNKPMWVFEGVDKSVLQHLSGPSAGQSTVMHALDVFLDIDHKLEKRRDPPPSCPMHKRPDTGFMERMRLYMPGLHRKYLEQLGGIRHTVRDLAQENSSLREPYNAAVLALKNLRDVHLRMVCRYIVTNSHAAPPAAIKRSGQECGVARGTGGNEASLLLKHGRDATVRAMLRDH